MTHLLPPNLLRLFAPRPPIPYLKPLVRDPEIPLHKKLDGVAAILEELREENAIREAEEEAKLNAEQKAAAAAASESTASGMKVDSSSTSVKKEDSDKKPNGVKKEDPEMEVEEGEEPAAPLVPIIKDKAAPSAGKTVKGEDDINKPVLVTTVPDGEALVYEEKGLLLDDSGKPFTYCEGEKLRQRRILRKRRREQAFEKALENCKTCFVDDNQSIHH
jgi:U1 small nuclear ribonucleoprotein